MKRIFPVLLALALCTTLVSCKKENKALVESAVVQTPESIVCLSPAATEIVFALGAQDCIKAVSEYTDYPPEALSLPVAGSFDGNGISLETVLSFDPDFVYLTDGMHNFLIEALEQNNIAYYLSKGDSIQSVEQEILDIGNITNHMMEAIKLVADIEESIAFCAENSSDAPTAYYEVWNAPYMTAGKSSFINDMITAIGAKNLYGSLDAAYPVISEEAIIADQPEIILIPASSGVTAQAVAARPGWETIPAVKNNRIYIIDDNTFARPGPRIAQSIKEVNAQIK